MGREGHLTWCFSHHRGVLRHWHHDGSWRRHKRWAMFSDFTHCTMGMCLPTSWEEGVLFLEGQGFLAFAAIGNCTYGKVPGQNLWHFGAPLCPIWRQHELHQVYTECESGDFFPEDCRVASGRIYTLCFYMRDKTHCWERGELSILLCITALGMLPPECLGLIWRSTRVNGHVALHLGPPPHEKIL